MKHLSVFLWVLLVILGACGQGEQLRANLADYYTAPAAYWASLRAAPTTTPIVLVYKGSRPMGFTLFDYVALRTPAIVEYCVENFEANLVACYHAFARGTPNFEPTIREAYWDLYFATQDAAFNEKDKPGYGFYYEDEYYWDECRHL